MLSGEIALINNHYYYYYFGVICGIFYIKIIIYYFDHSHFIQRDLDIIFYDQFFIIMCMPGGHCYYGNYIFVCCKT